MCVCVCVYIYTVLCIIMHSLLLCSQVRKAAADQLYVHLLTYGDPAPASEGPSKGGPWKEGALKKDPAKESPSKEGPSKEGPSKEGPSKEGPTELRVAVNDAPAAVNEGSGGAVEAKQDEAVGSFVTPGGPERLEECQVCFLFTDG